MVTIELSSYVRPTVKWFIMHYLFSKAQENGGKRIKGEEYSGEMHRQWEQFCEKRGKRCGNVASFRRELRNMKVFGVIELIREEEDDRSSMPRKYYVLSRDYFDELMNESRMKRK